MRFERLFISCILFFLFMAGVSHRSLCQGEIKGIVVDTETKEPLAFVHISDTRDWSRVWTTDLDGFFTLPLINDIDSLYLSLVGYEDLSLAYRDLDASDAIILEMSSTPIELQVVNIVPEENMANRIMSRVVRNSSQNDPHQLPAFRCSTCNKTTYDLNSLLQAFSDREDQQMGAGVPSWLMESVTIRRFVKPSHWHEDVLASKVAGVRRPSFAPISTEFQPFSFYDANISILDRAFINPVSRIGLSHYTFGLERRIYQGMDTIYVLSFGRKSGKNFDALKGVLYIHSAGYAIQNVIASPEEKGLVDFEIEQQYVRVDSFLWFPQELSFELSYTQVEDQNLSFNLHGHSYIYGVEVFGDLEKSDFPLEFMSFRSEAYAQDSSYWKGVRKVALSSEELRSYRVWDSLGSKYELDAKLRLAEYLGIGQIPIGPLSIDLKETLGYNRWEGTRLGLGMRTNEGFSKRIQLGAYFGYGWRDNRWKYGGEASVSLGTKSNVTLTARYTEDVRELGSLEWNTRRHSFSWGRELLQSRVDAVRRAEVAFGMRTGRSTQVHISVHSGSVNPLYSYRWRRSQELQLVEYKLTGVDAEFRWALGQKLFRIAGQRVNLGSESHTVVLSYSRGLGAAWGGDLSFSKVQVRFEASKRLGRLGHSKAVLKSGFVDSSLPIGLMFSGQGSRDRRFPVHFFGFFQTMEPYEFVSDRFIHLHYSHDFGSSLFYRAGFKPGVSLMTNLGWGSLKDADHHEGIEFQTMERGFIESGVLIENLLRINYLDLGYLGFGLGAFYRYGSYGLDRFGDNAVWRISVVWKTH